MRFLELLDIEPMQIYCALQSGAFRLRTGIQTPPKITSTINTSCTSNDHSIVPLIRLKNLTIWKLKLSKSIS